MKTFLKSIWGFLTISIIVIFILVNLLALKFRNSFWLEEEFHPHQYVEEATYYEAELDRHSFFMGSLLETDKEIKKREEEYRRERPYKLVTLYKDIKIECFGTIDYLKQYKCLEYNKAIEMYKEKLIADEKAEVEAEKLAKEIDILNNLNCE